MLWIVAVKAPKVASVHRQHATLMGNSILEYNQIVGASTGKPKIDDRQTVMPKTSQLRQDRLWEIFVG